MAVNLDTLAGEVNSSLSEYINRLVRTTMAEVLKPLQDQIDQLVAEKDTLKQTVIDNTTAVTTTMTGVKTGLQALRDKLAQGGGVTDADVAPLTDKVTQVIEDLKASTDQIAGSTAALNAEDVDAKS